MFGSSVIFSVGVCRCNESVDRGLLKSLLRMFVDLQIYQEVFELEFLGETETMYRVESLRMIRDPEFTVRQTSECTIIRIPHVRTHELTPPKRKNNCHCNPNLK